MQFKTKPFNLTNEQIESASGIPIIYILAYFIILYFCTIITPYFNNIWLIFVLFLCFSLVFLYNILFIRNSKRNKQFTDSRDIWLDLKRNELKYRIGAAAFKVELDKNWYLEDKNGGVIFAEIKKSKFLGIPRSKIVFYPILFVPDQIWPIETITEIKKALREIK